MERFDLYVVTGNAGTGKTTLAKKIAKPLGVQVLDLDLMRQELGITTYDRADTPRVMGEIFERMDRSLHSREPAVLATAYVRREAREQSYEQLRQISLEIGQKLDAVLIQCVCDEATAKARIRSRVPTTGVHSSGNNPAIYDRYAKVAEPLLKDEIDQNPDFSFLSYDSSRHTLKRITARPRHFKALKILETLIRKQD